MFTGPIFACANVDFEKFRHGTPLSEINNAVEADLCFSHFGRSTLYKA